MEKLKRTTVSLGSGVSLFVNQIGLEISYVTSLHQIYKSGTNTQHLYTYMFSSTFILYDPAAVHRYTDRYYQ